MSLLFPDTGLLFWMIISFGIVFFILAKFGFPVITKMVEKRSSYINSSLEAARLAEEKLATLNKQVEEILDKARIERNAILNEARETKNRIIGEARDTADVEARVRISRAIEEIEESKKRALGEIRGQIADISVRIAEKVIGEKLNNDQQQKMLIDRLLEQEKSLKL
ncbi:MAG: F0F1 ATP synthase subunit B [Prevotellaceae bacterium]|jgi:F-type H+-transporting ATPase subunit b|nr:F0F1 ATP synthase subunit B [Prevotellaceae bacterium]